MGFIKFWKWDPTREMLDELYWGRGLSRSEIGNIFRVSNTAVLGAMKRFNIPRRERESWVTRPRLKPNLSSSPELAYILAVLKGDGWTVKRDFTLRLRVKSKEFAESFKSTLEKIGLHPFFCTEKGTWEGYYTVVAGSKLFFEWYQQLSLDQINEVANSSDEAKLSFIRGFYESEGSFGIYNNKPRVSLSNINEKMIYLIRDLLSSVGLDFKFTINTKSGAKTPMFVLTNYRKREILDFFNKIRPCIRNPINHIPYVFWAMRGETTRFKRGQRFIPRTEFQFKWKDGKGMVF